MAHKYINMRGVPKVYYIYIYIYIWVVPKALSGTSKNIILLACVDVFFLFLLVPKLRKYLLFDQYFVAVFEQAKNIILFACGLFGCFFCFLLVSKVRKYLFLSKYFFGTSGTSKNDNDSCLWIIWMINSFFCLFQKRKNIYILLMSRFWNKQKIL
jgi:hypothetical protein